jgi:TonB family protein
VILVAVGVLVLRNRGGPPAPAVPVATPPAPPATVAAPPETGGPPVEAQKVVDQKLVEAEARRLAAEAEKARREAEKKRTAGKLPAATAVPPPGLSLAPQGPLQPPKATETPPAKPSPQAVAAPPPPVVKVAPPAEPQPAVEEAATKPPPPTAAPVAPTPANSGPVEGELVGPGEGVVEPKVLAMGAFTGLPPQAWQLAHASGDGSLGTSILMALIDENGKVTDVRVVKGAPFKFVDEAAIRALRNAKIAPATKFGVKVKMWSTIAVTVKL